MQEVRGSIPLGSTNKNINEINDLRSGINRKYYPRL
jgi:hypothetical protein